MHAYTVSVKYGDKLRKKDYRAELRKKQRLLMAKGRLATGAMINTMEAKSRRVCVVQQTERRTIQRGAMRKNAQGNVAR